MPGCSLLLWGPLQGALGQLAWPPITLDAGVHAEVVLKSGAGPRFYISHKLPDKAVPAGHGVAGSRGLVRPSGRLRPEGKASCRQEGPSLIGDVTAAAGDQRPAGEAGRWGLLGGNLTRAAVSPGAGPDRLPALAVGHADPGGGTPAVRRAPLPHRRGEAPAPPSGQQLGKESASPPCGSKGLPSERNKIKASLPKLPPAVLSSSPAASLTLPLGLSACPPLPASERSAWNPVPAELIRVQPPPADRLVGLPGAAQGAGWPWGAGAEGAPQQATSSQGEASRG